MDDLERVAKLKRQLDSLQREADKSEGALEQSQKQLREDFSCKDTKAARKLLKKLKREEAAKRRRFQEALEKFREDWKEKLDA